MTPCTDFHFSKFQEWFPRGVDGEEEEEEEVVFTGQTKKKCNNHYQC